MYDDDHDVAAADQNPVAEGDMKCQDTPALRLLCTGHGLLGNEGRAQVLDLPGELESTSSWLSFTDTYHLQYELFYHISPSRIASRRTSIPYINPSITLHALARSPHGRPLHHHINSQ
jgi:hypothetical protein